MLDSPADDRIPGLDGLRGIAILLVLLFHYTLFGPFTRFLVNEHPLLRHASTVALAGWAGVDLFFVLSGFLITRNLLRAKESPGFFRTFYARRALRIFPVYYLFLLASAAFAPASSLWHASGGQILCLWAYLTNLGIGLQGWEAIPLPYHHFWSLAVEEQFYLV